MGINLDQNNYIFNFQNNSGQNLIIEFTEFPLEPILLENKGIYYYGFEFTSETPSKIRKEFFKKLRFGNLIPKEDLHNFIKLGVLKLFKVTNNIYDFGHIIIPKSRSELNSKIVKIFTKQTNIDLSIIELIKELPKNIQFDWKKFKTEELDSEVNGRPRYTKDQKLEQINKITNILDDIRNSNYFSIAESVTKNKYKQYFSNFLKLNDSEESNEFRLLRDCKKPILIIDDVTTTGTTLFECLKTLRFINSTVNIIIFTLIGKKDIHF
jgi:hypothetical protein